MEEKKYDVFISYRRNDVVGYARLIKQELEKNFNVFFDVESINPSEVFPTRLEEAIQNSKIILFIIGVNSCQEFNKRIGHIDYVVEEIKYAKKYDKVLLPLLIDEAVMPDKECLIKFGIGFFSDLEAHYIYHKDFENNFAKLKHIIRDQLGKRSNKIKKEFDNAKDLLSILYPHKTLVCEEKGSIKYQFWTCGKDADPNYYLVFFPSTTSISRAVNSFIDKIQNNEIKKPKRLLTILRDTNIRTSTLELLEKNNIEYLFYTYQDYFWEECISNEIKNYKYNIMEDEYYIDQNLYDFSDLNTQKPIGKASDVVMDYIKNNSVAPVLAIIAQAGTGKTTFIERIIKRIDKSPKLQCIYISSDDIKEKFSKTETLPSIESVYHLYEYCNDERKFDEQKLIMGIISGSIVIIIDGLEEIIGLFNTQNKFHSNRFFDSLIEINNKLSKCKVIVTSREPTDEKNDLINRNEITTYRLQGFDDELVTSYLEKRFPKSKFINQDLADKHIKKTQKYIKDINDTFKSKKTIPYILDLVCESVEEELSGTTANNDLVFELHNEYFSNHDAIDAIVYSYFFSRELFRQEYPENFTAKDLAYIFIDLSLSLGWVFSEEQMKKVIEETYPYQYEQIAANLTNAPLLKKSEEGFYRFKYDFLENYFKCLYLIQVFGGEKLEHYPYDTLAYLPKEIIDDFIKYFTTSERREVFMKVAKYILNELIEKIKKLENNYKYQMAVSNLIYFTIRIYSESMSAEKNMEIVKRLYSIEENINRIEHIYILSKSFPLDFQEMEIWNSKFIEFENFFKSKFLKTKFYYTLFDNNKQFYNKEQIWNDISFDITCDLGDMKSIISQEVTSMEIKKRMIKILRDINRHAYKYIDKDKIILECLEKVSYLRHENSAYRLTGNGKSLINGKTSRKTREVIECILSKKNRLYYM